MLEMCCGLPASIVGIDRGLLGMQHLGAPPTHCLRICMLTRSQVIPMHLKVQEACMSSYQLMGIKPSLYFWCDAAREQIGRREKGSE